MSTIGKQIPASEMGNFMARMAESLASEQFDRPLQDMLAEVKQQHRDNFTSSTGPDGAPWPPRKNRGDGHPLLIESGDLLQAATGGGRGHIGVARDKSLAVGVDTSLIEYAAIHQHGTAKIPARPFVGVPEETLDEFEEVLAEYLTGEVL